MFEPDDITVICPRNDLESAEILRIATERGLDVRESDQLWGGTLGREPANNLLNLRRVVVVVELPDVEAEVRLRLAGHEVIVIDHHNYFGLLRWKPQGSLEQFCNLLGHPMTRELWEVAVNDQDFIPGLFNMGLSYEEMEKVRKREREILDTADRFDEARACVSEYRLHFTDLDVLVAPERLRTVMGEAAQWPDPDKYRTKQEKGEVLHLPNCLVLFHKDGDRDRLVQVEYFGSDRLRPAFDELLQDPSLKDFYLWGGGGSHNCYWGARGNHLGADIDRLVDRVLSFALVDGRPLRHLHTTFLFAYRFAGADSTHLPEIGSERCQEEFLPRLDGQEDGDEENTEQAQEAIYFLRHVRELLYRQGDGVEAENNAEAVRTWKLRLDDGKHFLHVHRDNPELDITLPIQRVSVYQFFNGIHILSISVEESTNPDWWKGFRNFWRTLVDAEFPQHRLRISLRDALAFNNLARIVYETYPEQPVEGKIANYVEWVLNAGEDDRGVLAQFRHQGMRIEGGMPVISDLALEMVRAFLKDPATCPQLDPILDDRMFVHTQIVLCGEPPSHPVGEDLYYALYSLAVYVDSDGWDHAGGYTYDPTFVKGILEPATNRRWYAISGNLYGFSRFSAAYLGFGWFLHAIVSRHVRTMYLKMSLMALFYRASLVDYARQIARIAQPENRTDAPAMNEYMKILSDVHWDLVRFADRHWFSELTYQDQGIELFDLQRKAMDFQQDYDAAISDVQRAYQFMDMQLQRQMADESIELAGHSTEFARQSTWAAIGALVFAVIAIVTGYFGMNFEVGRFDEAIRRESVFWLVTGVTTVVILIFVGVLIYLTVKWRKRPPSPRGGPRV